MYDLARNRVIQNSPPKRLEILGNPQIVKVPTLDKPEPVKPDTSWHLPAWMGGSNKKSGAVDPNNPLLK